MTDISNALQQDILSLLVWNEEFCPLLVNTVEPNLFVVDIYRKIALKAFAFWKTFKKPIGTHLPGELEDELQGKKKDMYEEVLQYLYENKKDINTEYVQRTLENFLRRGNITQAAMDALTAAQNGNLDKAEMILNNLQNKNLNLFDPGIRVGVDFKATFNFLNIADTSKFLLGIPSFDRLGITPARKEMFVIMGSGNVGKTWCVVNMAKINIMAKKTVVILTLESPQDKINQRYQQALFSICKSESKFKQRFYIDLETDGYSNLTSFEKKKLGEKDIKFFNHQKDVKWVQDKYKKYGRMLSGLVIKEFPPEQLTIQGINAYLENLEQLYGIIPDILVVDYPEMMAIDTKNFRIHLGSIIKSLIGIAVSRNISVVIPFQGNRESLDPRILWLTGKHLSEDYSVFKHAHTMISLNQTEGEQRLGIMRGFNVRCRDERKGDKVLFSTNFDIGQFCLGSSYIYDTKEYSDMFTEFTGKPLIVREKSNYKDFGNGEAA